MTAHRALSATVTAAIFALGLATTSAAGTPALGLAWTDGSTSQFCIVNSGQEVANVQPTSSEGEMYVVLTLPKSADPDKIAVLPPDGWKTGAREYQQPNHVLVISITPEQPIAVKAGSVATCFELSGIGRDELGPIGLAGRQRDSSETAPRARR